MRTEFNGLKRNLTLSLAFIVISLGLCAGAVLFWVKAVYTFDYIISVGLAVFGPIGLLVSILSVAQWSSPFRVTLTDAGVDVLLAGQEIALPWSDIATMRITERWPNGAKMPWRRDPTLKNTRVRWLVAEPAAHIDADDGTPLPAALWQVNRWQLFATHTVDAHERQVVAALRAIVPGHVSVEVDTPEIRRYA
jgi:hypothetical protein